MIRRPPRSTRTDTLFPYTTLFRSKLNTAVAGKAKRDSQAQSERLSGIAAPSLMHSGWMTGNHCGPPSCSAALSRHDVIPDATIDGRLYDPLSRSEERRVGKECVSTCRSRCAPYH